MGYISDSKSYREFMRIMEKEMEDKIVKDKNNTVIKDKITQSVINDLESRAERGLKKYNTTLGENNHQNMLQHAYEEALDLAQYLKKEITTLNTVQDLVKQLPNDTELGEYIRIKYGQNQTN
jgi:predicted phage-related endonuclease